MTRNPRRLPVTDNDGVVDPLIVAMIAEGKRIPATTPVTLREKQVAADVLDSCGATRSTICSFTGSSNATLDRWLANERKLSCPWHGNGHRFIETVRVCGDLPWVIAAPKTEVSA